MVLIVPRQRDTDCRACIQSRTQYPERERRERRKKKWWFKRWGEREGIEIGEREGGKVWKIFHCLKQTSGHLFLSLFFVSPHSLSLLFLSTLFPEPSIIWPSFIGTGAFSRGFQSSVKRKLHVCSFDLSRRTRSYPSLPFFPLRPILHRTTKMYIPTSPGWSRDELQVICTALKRERGDMNQRHEVLRKKITIRVWYIMNDAPLSHVYHHCIASYQGSFDHLTIPFFYFFVLNTLQFSSTITIIENNKIGSDQFKKQNPVPVIMNSHIIDGNLAYRRITTFMNHEF